MATKYQFISALYEHTLKGMTETPATWTDFLRSACRNYKCRFDEQVLIYAQRPDTTAVLEIEKWNNQFGRWVNKGAKGIAVFDERHPNIKRLRHYFDVSDTYGSHTSCAVPLLNVQPEHEAEIVESLQAYFSESEPDKTLTTALTLTASPTPGKSCNKTCLYTRVSK